MGWINSLKALLQYVTTLPHITIATVASAISLSFLTTDILSVCQIGHGS
jgi:hypothetical protein